MSGALNPPKLQIQSSSQSRPPLDKRQQGPSASNQGRYTNQNNQRPVDVSKSNNPYINGSLIYIPSRNGVLYVDCGEIGHVKKFCTNTKLSFWKKSQLAIIIFPDTHGPSYNTANYALAFYITEPASPVVTPTTTISNFTPSLSSVNLLSYRYSLLKPLAKSYSAEAFLKKGSAPNKRAHIKQPDISSVPLNTASEAPRHGPSFVFPSEADRPKRKGRKTAGKQAVIAPLVNIINEKTGYIDQQTSIRNLLKSQKIDLTWMDFCAWSPTVCRKIKRLLTRMSNRKKKKKSTAIPVPVPNTFDFTMPQTQTQAESVSTIEVNGNTRFLSTLIGYNKAFRIPCSVRLTDNSNTTKEISLNKSQVQADQGSDINVMSTALAKQLRLELHPLSSIGFAGMTMRTADNRETMLYHWVYLDIGVAGIWRKIRCFVAPEQSSMNPSSEHLSLLLGIPWLYGVNATLSIRGSKIKVEDPNVGEKVRDIIGPELIFCRNHNLLMYPKAILAPKHDDNSNSNNGDEDLDSDSSIDLNTIQHDSPKVLKKALSGF